jgi:hypothetical protein
MRKNRSVWFDFSGSTVLVASRGQEVSFTRRLVVVSGAFESSLGSRRM